MEMKKNVHNKYHRSGKEIVLVLMVCMLLMTSLSGCALFEGVKMAKTVINFQKAAQSMDVETMLDCMDPSIKKKIETSVGVLSIFGFESSEILDKISELLLGVTGSTGSEDIFSSMSIKKVKVKVNGDEGEFIGTMRYEMDGGAFEKQCSIKMIKQNDQWYISGFSILN